MWLPEDRCVISLAVGSATLSAGAGVADLLTAVAIGLGTVLATVLLYFTHELWTWIRSGFGHDHNMLFLLMPGSRPAAQVAVGNSTGHTRVTDRRGYLHKVRRQWRRNGEPLNVFVDGRVYTVEVSLDDEGRPLPVEIWTDRP